MPRAQTHRVVAGVVGLVSSHRAALAAGSPQPVVEAVGGLVSAAFLTGVLADTLEPPTSPNHRGVAHSIVLAAVLWQVIAPRLRPMAVRSRRDAADYLRRAEDSSLSDWQRLDARFSASLNSLFAGALEASVPGYLSHLAADAATPSSLPLLGLPRMT